MPSEDNLEQFQELTSAQRQKTAFDYIRDKARLAHNEGDGITVNLLSLLALTEAKSLS